MITNEQLFQEDFKPQWLAQKERLVKESFDYAVTVAVELKWKELARESELRIIAKHSSHPMRVGCIERGSLPGLSRR